MTQKELFIFHIYEQKIPTVEILQPKTIKMLASRVKIPLLPMQMISR